MKHRFARLAVSGVCVVVMTSVLGVAAASSSPIDGKQAEAAQLQKEIDANGEKISALAERYDAAKLRLDEANANVARVQHDIDSTEAEMNKTRGLVAQRAAAMYVGAGGQTPIDDIMSGSVAEVGARTKYASTTASRDQQLIAHLAAARTKLRAGKATLDDVKKRAQKDFDAIASSRKQIEDANTLQNALLAQVKGEIKKYYDDAVASAERAQGMDPGNVAIPNAPAPNPGAALAVAYAKAQLGKPYRYGGTGPDAFDCSGLTMMAWAQAGVSMPHGSVAQGNMFPRVADNAMAPGDLVIYYPDHHHVGIYVGDGMTISATHTGDFVRLQPVFREGFQYAVRPG